MRIKALLTFLAVVMLCQVSLAAKSAAKTAENVPMIGAQIFVEPGQSEEDIDQFFRIMKDNGMTVGRIRVFGVHVMKPDGSADFSLYDTAFAKAEKYGIKMFVTLFPPTDELTDVGGFKFPKSKQHLKDVERYIRLVVNRYKDSEALHTWVLQNEPGGFSLESAGKDWLEDMRSRYYETAERYVRKDNEYLKADFTKENFCRFCQTEYLSWIADVVKSCDPVHGRHVNPHQILDNIASYEFPKYEKFLTSLGASMHQSWHFDYFSRPQLTTGVSIMSDIIRDAAGKNPFWITELQGGNVTASGARTLCPTGEETAQWLWTGVSAGAKGVIFWSLNQRKAVKESGEWGLLDFQRNPSDRLEAAASVAGTIDKYSAFFENAKPVKSDITILYNVESVQIQTKNAQFNKGVQTEGKKASAVMKSVCGAYEAVSAWGVIPEICDMAGFDWSDAEGKCIILPNIVSLPSVYWDKIRSFVKNGGKAVVTGFTGFYDEYMGCNHMGGFPLKDCFGAEIKEYKVGDMYYDIDIKDAGFSVPAHLWTCSILTTTAKPICYDGTEISGVENTYGKGKVIWLPIMVELGGWCRNPEGVASFYGKYCAEEIAAAPFRFAESTPGVIARTMKNGNKNMLLIINKNKTAVEVGLEGIVPAQKNLVFGEASVLGKTVSLKPEGCAVFIY